MTFHVRINTCQEISAYIFFNKQGLSKTLGYYSYHRARIRFDDWVQSGYGAIYEEVSSLVKAFVFLKHLIEKTISYTFTSTVNRHLCLDSFDLLSYWLNKL